MKKSYSFLKWLSRKKGRVKSLPLLLIKLWQVTVPLCLELKINFHLKFSIRLGIPIILLYDMGLANRFPPKMFETGFPALFGR